MDKFIVNIIHRPEMVPEYAEKVTGHGKEEDIGRKALLTESLDIFKFQQETAHKYGLKTTIQIAIIAAAQNTNSFFNIFYSQIIKIKQFLSDK